MAACPRGSPAKTRRLANQSQRALGEIMAAPPGCKQGFFFSSAASLVLTTCRGEGRSPIPPYTPDSGGLCGRPPSAELAARV